MKSYTRFELNRIPCSYRYRLQAKTNNTRVSYLCFENSYLLRKCFVFFVIYLVGNVFLILWFRFVSFTQWSQVLIQFNLFLSILHFRNWSQLYKIITTIISQISSQVDDVSRCMHYAHVRIYFSMFSLRRQSENDLKDLFSVSFLIFINFYRDKKLFFFWFFISFVIDRFSEYVREIDLKTIFYSNFQTQKELFAWIWFSIRKQ